MVRSTLALALVSQLAFADDTPRMYQPPAPGETVGYPNWVLTPDGKEKLDATLARNFSELVQLRTENASLKHSLVEMESKPAMTWKGAAVLLAVGAVVGAGVAVSIVVAAR